MSIILYTPSAMYADSQGTCGSSRLLCIQKLFREGNTVLGVCGSVDHAESLLHWWRNGRNPEKWPAVQKTDDYSILLEGTRDGVLVYERSPFPWKPRRNVGTRGSFHYAVGSGAPVCRAALLAGADPLEAMRITCEISDGCGGEIQVQPF